MDFKYKLGKLALKKNLKTLSLKKYLTGLPTPPKKLWREYKVPPDSWQMFGNDFCGDCTCAAKAHIMMLMTAHTGTMFTPDPKDVIAMYSAISGYDPVTKANDNGCAMTDVLEYMQTTGLSGHKILGWAAIDFTNPAAVLQAMYIFGAVDIGFNVPQSALDQFNAKQDWDVVPDDGGIVGGHDVPYFGAGGKGNSCVTWAANQKSTNAFNLRYWDEAYVLLSQDWVNNASGLAPNMINMDSLLADLKTIAA